MNFWKFEIIYKNTKLRFSGFNEDWEIKKLDDLSKIQRGASPRPISSKKWYDFENKNVGWVRIGDVTASSKYLTETEDYFSEEGVKKSRFLPKGSLIMSICATIGKPIITDIDTCIHDGFVGFSKLNINKEFLYYYLNILEPKFYSLSQTGSQANLNSDLVRISKIGVPSVNEQEKIVNFLSLIDNKIELLKKKYESYIDFKKYLMQQIFAQKLRFDYDIVKLKDISKINKGKQLNKDNMIENGKYYVLNGGKDSSGYTNEWNTPENTITISEGGNSCGYVNFNTEKFWSGGHCYYLTNISENVDKYYLYSYLKFKEEFIMRLRVGSGLPNIQKGDVENIKIQIVSKDNQNKISNLLLSADKKIDSIQIQKESFENFKQGLLQQMFVYWHISLNFCAKICCIKYFLKF